MLYRWFLLLLLMCLSACVFCFFRFFLWSYLVLFVFILNNNGTHTFFVWFLFSVSEHHLVALIAKWTAIIGNSLVRVLYVPSYAAQATAMYCCCFFVIVSTTADNFTIQLLNVYTNSFEFICKLFVWPLDALYFFPFKIVVWLSI